MVPLAALLVVVVCTYYMAGDMKWPLGFSDYPYMPNGDGSHRSGSSGDPNASPNSPGPGSARRTSTSFDASPGTPSDASPGTPSEMPFRTPSG